MNPLECRRQMLRVLEAKGGKKNKKKEEKEKREKKRENIQKLRDDGGRCSIGRLKANKYFGRQK